MDGLLGRASFGFAPNYRPEPDFSNLGDKILIGNPVNPKTGRTGQGFIALEPRRHFLSIAPNRTGKGTTLIINNLLNYRGSVVVIDPKGENAYITAKRRRELGQKTIILDPFNTVNERYGQHTGELEEVSHFNPLSILDPYSPSYADDLAYLADALIITQSKNDPFFDDSARDLVAGIMAYAVEKYGPKATFEHIRQMIASTAAIPTFAEEAQGFGKVETTTAKPKPKGRHIAALAREKRRAHVPAESKLFESMAARKLAAFIVDSKTNQSVIKTAQVQTAFLDSSPLLQNLSCSDFSFDDLTEGNTTIYFVLPVAELDTKGRWLRLLLSIAIRQLTRNKAP